MTPENYQARIEASIPPQKTFDCINRVSDWWVRDISGNPQKTGDTFRVNFGDTFVEFEVTEMEPAKKIVWLVTDSHLPFLQDKEEWTGTKVVFEISATAGGSAIEMSHVGLTPSIECYETCCKGWEFFIRKSLSQLMNTGIGAPDTPQAQRS